MNDYLAMGVGGILTFVVQSSSVASRSNFVEGSGGLGGSAEKAETSKL